jgi:NAD(P)-dependent dehydrogenase (short-subunit alcohol dehydrogenase family)
MGRPPLTGVIPPYETIGNEFQAVAHEAIRDLQAMITDHSFPRSSAVKERMLPTPNYLETQAVGYPHFTTLSFIMTETGEKTTNAKADFVEDIGHDFTATLHHDIYASIDPTKSDLSQPSKVVLVTGSGRGIGRSIALRYADSGVACIFLCSKTSSELDEVEGAIKARNADVKVRKLKLDITDDMQVLHAADLVREEGRLDVLINNAGVGARPALIAESDVDSYWKIWTVHMKGTYMATRAFLPLLLATAKNQKRQVDIVNTSSDGAHATHASVSAYQTSKFALLRFTEFVNAEYGEQGVNCFAVHPGCVLTEMTKRSKALRPSRYYLSSSEL